MEEKVTIELKKRIADITQIVVRPPVALDVWDFELDIEMRKLDFGKMLNLSVKLVDVPKTIIEELCMADTMKLVEVVTNFLSGGLA